MEMSNYEISTRKLIEYIEENTEENGKLFFVDPDTFRGIANTTSPKTYQTMRYSVSLTSRPNIVMEIDLSTNPSGTRAKSAYGFRKISNPEEYELSEINFRILTDDKIKYIVDKAKEQGYYKDYTSVLPILYYVDVLMSRNTKNNWSIINSRFFTMYFFIPADIINTYRNKLIEYGILHEQRLFGYVLSKIVFPWEKDVYDTNLSIPDISAEDIVVIGYNHYSKNNIFKVLEDKLSKSNIVNENSANSYTEQHNKIFIDKTQDCDIINKHTNDAAIYGSDVITLLTDVIRKNVGALIQERDSLKEQLAESEVKFSKDYDVFKKLSDEYSSSINEMEAIKKSYASPEAIEKYKSELSNRIKNVLNKFMLDVTDELAKMDNNSVSVNETKANIIAISADTRQSIASVINTTSINKNKEEEKNE